MATTQFTEHVMILVNQGQKNKAEQAAAAVAPGGGDVFTNGMNPSGNPNAPKTWWWCYWVMTAADKAALIAELDSRNTQYELIAGDIMTGGLPNPQAELASRGMKRAQERHIPKP